MAIATSLNQYEQAFENWLIDNGVRYVAVDQHKRRFFARGKIKSFDFLLYPGGTGPIIAEVKGRKFRGTNLSGLRGMENWVTMDDVRGLISWERIFKSDPAPRKCGNEAAFIFAYRFENVDVDADGREVYDFEDHQYVFCAVRLDDYRQFMTVRSPKWQTVTMPAAKFREFAIPLREFLLGEEKY